MLNVVMLSVNRLSVVMLSVVKLSVVKLSVVMLSVRRGALPTSVMVFRENVFWSRVVAPIVQITFRAI
jgi:hypothetical protein